MIVFNINDNNNKYYNINNYIVINYSISTKL